MKQRKALNSDTDLVYRRYPDRHLGELTPRAKEILESVDVIAAEDTRNTIKLLSHFQIQTHLIAHHKFNEAATSKGTCNC